MKILKSQSEAWVLVNGGIPIPATCRPTRQACIGDYLIKQGWAPDTWTRYRRNGAFACIKFRFVPTGNSDNG